MTATPYGYDHPDAGDRSKPDTPLDRAARAAYAVDEPPVPLEYERVAVRDYWRDIAAAALQVMADDLRGLHQPNDLSLSDIEDRWCVHCAEGWDSEDFELIRYPCATLRRIAAFEE